MKKVVFNMSIKRYSGAAFAAVSSRKRFTGSGWVDLTIGKRWNGSAWVDLWSNSSGGSGDSGGGSGDSGGGSGGSGVLFSDLKSTVSSPTVHYSCAYEVTDFGVSLSFKGWLNSSASSLGNGIKLTVFARLGGGAWASVVLKQSGAVWRGTEKHSASLILNGTASGRTKIELYVTRAGSTYGGSAGNLGSAKSPKSYYFNA